MCLYSRSGESPATIFKRLQSSSKRGVNSSDAAIRECEKRNARKKVAMREKKWRFTIRDSNSENAEAMQGKKSRCTIRDSNSENAEAMQEKKWRFTIHDSNSESAVAMQRREKGKMGDNLKRKVYLKRTRYRHVSRVGLRHCVGLLWPPQLSVPTAKCPPKYVMT